MHLRLALAVLLIGCGSVDTPGGNVDGGGGGGDGGGGGGDGGGGGPDAHESVTSQLTGVWDVNITDGVDVVPCTATFGADVVVECPDRYQPDASLYPDCYNENTLRIRGTWDDAIGLTIEGIDDYNEACPAMYIDMTEEVATMTGTRTAPAASTGLWGAVGGTWHVEGFDTGATTPDVTCQAMFDPGTSQTGITVTCDTPWEGPNVDGCDSRAHYVITGTYTDGAFAIDFMGETQHSGTCTAPEPWEPFEISAVRQ